MSQKKDIKIGIINRGEVALRIIRACQLLNKHSVLFHSEPDIKTIAYREASETILLEGASAKDTYLNQDKIIELCLENKITHMHPGFGFLSENPNFAKKLEDNNIQFIGPTSESITLFGDKIQAKELAQKAGVPLIPGLNLQNQKLDLKELTKLCNKIGFPVLAKAAFGGGGRGMRVIESETSILEMVQAAQSESLQAFGRPELFLEKYLNKSKHVEVQFFKDFKKQVYIIGDRECSLQRRHQKLLEESPCAAISEEQRSFLHSCVKKLLEMAPYRGAGTAEFLFQENEFYFLEVNTRLQVEHTVTESTFGVDLVQAQLLDALEQPIPYFKENSFTPRGHSLECRILAENQKGFPSIGNIHFLELPHTPFVRYDFGVQTGDRITEYYDSMIGKVIVWGSSRKEALNRMLTSLKQITIFGIETNINNLIAFLSLDSIQKNEHLTQDYAKLQKQVEIFLEKNLLDYEDLKKAILNENCSSSNLKLETTSNANTQSSNRSAPHSSWRQEWFRN